MNQTWDLLGGPGLVVTYMPGKGYRRFVWYEPELTYFGLAAVIIASLVHDTSVYMAVVTRYVLWLMRFEVGW